MGGAGGATQQVVSLLFLFFINFTSFEKMIHLQTVHCAPSAETEPRPTSRNQDLLEPSAVTVYLVSPIWWAWVLSRRRVDAFVPRTQRVNLRKVRQLTRLRQTYKPLNPNAAEAGSRGRCGGRRGGRRGWGGGRPVLHRPALGPHSPF